MPNACQRIVAALVAVLVLGCANIARAGGGIDEAQFNQALQRWDRTCQAAVRSFAKVRPAEADALYFDQDNNPIAHLESTDAHNNLEKVVEPLLTRWSEHWAVEKLDSEDIALVTALERHGLSLEATEGCPFLLVNQSRFENAAKPSLTQDLRDYLDVKQALPPFYYSDGGCRFDVSQMADYAFAWEAFIKDNPRNAHKDKARKEFRLLMEFILMSDLPNTPAFANNGKGVMDEAWRKELRSFVQKRPDSIVAKITADFLAAIKADGYRLSRANKDKFKRRIADAFTPAMSAQAPSSRQGDKLVGKHAFRLQWVEGKPGSAQIAKTADGLRIKGRQEAGGNWVTIEGTIRMLNPRELAFTGEIVTRVSYVAHGKACVRSGEFTFYAKDERKFWRMQQMQNPCDQVTDYVDIFF